MTSYQLDMSWAGAVQCPPYKILAKVDEDGREVNYWVIMGLEHGFLGIPVGKEREADMHNVPGVLWGDVVALGQASAPGAEPQVEAAFAKIDALMHAHNGTVHGEHEGHDHDHHTHTHAQPAQPTRGAFGQSIGSQGAAFQNRAQRRAQKKSGYTRG